MRPLFPIWTNAFFQAAAASLVLGAMLMVGFLFLYVRSPLFRREGEEVVQPLPFDHRHHLADDGIDCLYCHDLAPRAASAGYPSVSRCMNCHSQVWNQSPLTAALRADYFTFAPLVWNRVYKLPDFVYFDHSIHLAKGVGCVTCHGRVDRMPAVRQAVPLTMEWCLDCHRQPWRWLRPRRFLTSTTWRPSGGEALGRALMRQYDVHPGTDCTTCHR